MPVCSQLFGASLGRTAKPSLGGLIRPQGGHRQGPRAGPNSVSGKTDLDKRTFFFGFHDVVGVCFPAPSALTCRQQNSVLENLNWQGFSKNTV